MLTKTLSFLSAILLIVPIAGSGTTTPEHPDSLVVLPNAQDVRFDKEGRLSSVSYRLRAHYPAHDVLADLNTALVEKGWAVTSHSFLNPDIPSSFVRGWTRSQGGGGDDTLLLLQWTASWVNFATQDVVTYFLSYSVPAPAGGDLPDTESSFDDLSVKGIYIDAKTAKEQRGAQK